MSGVDLDRARRLLAAPGPMAALTGAGVSAESGVPTFRGPGGLWENHRPEELATPQAFARDPALVWRWYAWRRELVSRCRPNPAHEALARWEARRPGDFTLITQNVDGLHQAAGSRRVICLHGDLWVTRCRECAWLTRDPDWPTAPPPTCPRCGSLARPGVVWFGESLDPEHWRAAMAAAAGARVFLVVGTSAVVRPAAGLAAVAARTGAKVVEINPQATELSPLATVSLRGPAGELLPALLEEP